MQENVTCEQFGLELQNLFLIGLLNLLSTTSPTNVP